MLAAVDAPFIAATAYVEALSVDGWRCFNLDGMQADDAAKIVNDLDIARRAVPGLPPRHPERLHLGVVVGPVDRGRVVRGAVQYRLRA